MKEILKQNKYYLLLIFLALIPLTILIELNFDFVFGLALMFGVFTLFFYRPPPVVFWLFSIFLMLFSVTLFFLEAECLADRTTAWVFALMVYPTLREIYYLSKR